MATDPSIILGIKPPQIDNPLDTASKALTVRNLMQQGQENTIKLNEMQRQASDQQTMRNLYKANTEVAPDGTVHFDRQGYLAGLNKENPMLGQSEGLRFRQMDLDQMTQQHALEKQIAFSIPVGEDVPPDQKQAAWAAGIQRAKQYGLPGLDHLPEQYPGDSAMRRMQMMTLTAEEQLAQKKQQTDLARQQQEADAKTLEARAKFYESAGVDPGANLKGASPGQTLSGNKPAPNLVASNGPGGSMGPQQNGAPPPKTYAGNPPPKVQNEAMKNYLQHIESRSQSADVVQAAKDVQSADKINEAIMQAPKGDLSKLSTNQMRMIFSEGTKMATGGVPTQTELDELTPNNFAQKSASWWQKLSNKPVPSNAGEFVKQLQDYANGIGKQGMDRITAMHNDTADLLRPQLGEDQYKFIKDQTAHKYDNSLTRKVLLESSAKAPPEGSTKEWNGKTYKIVGDHWVAQQKQATK